MAAPVGSGNAVALMATAVARSCASVSGPDTGTAVVRSCASVNGPVTGIGDANLPSMLVNDADAAARVISVAAPVGSGSADADTATGVARSSASVRAL